MKVELVYNLENTVRLDLSYAGYLIWWEIRLNYWCCYFRIDHYLSFLIRIYECSGLRDIFLILMGFVICRSDNLYILFFLISYLSAGWHSGEYYVIKSEN